MIDLHNHLLPGIDDGARRVEETLQFLRLARADGVHTVVATPHMKPGVYDNDRETILRMVATIREAQKGDECEPVRLLPGAEVYFTADLVERARAGSLMTYADGGRYLLLELPYQQLPLRVEDTLFQLRLLGITPVLAHPERVAYYLEDVERVATAVRLGALTQVTANSITGRFGDRAREYCHDLLDRGLLHVVATDSHDTRHRPPTLSEALRAVASRVGETAARAMVQEVPHAIIEGRSVEPPEPQPPARRRFGDRLRAFWGPRKAGR